MLIPMCDVIATRRTELIRLRLARQANLTLPLSSYHNPVSVPACYSAAKYMGRRGRTSATLSAADAALDRGSAGPVTRVVSIRKLARNRLTWRSAAAGLARQLTPWSFRQRTVTGQTARGRAVRRWRRSSWVSGSCQRQYSGRGRSIRRSRIGRASWPLSPLPAAPASLKLPCDSPARPYPREPPCSSV